MKINNDQLAAANKATVDSLLAAASTALASAERIARLNLDTARSALEDANANSQALFNARDPQEFAAIQSSLVQPSIEKAVEYSRSVMAISHAAQQEFARMFETHLAEFQKSATAILEQSGVPAPGGSENAFAPLQAAIASAREAYNAIAAQMQSAGLPAAPDKTRATRAAASRKTAK